MKCTARNVRILTSEEMLTILRKSATLYSEYVDTTLLFIFRKSKSDTYDHYEVRFGKNNFMHLAGIKSESLNANEFYEACRVRRAERNAVSPEVMGQMTTPIIARATPTLPMVLRQTS